MNLEKLRIERKMTQIDVALRVGVSLQAYRWWEKGVSKPNEENYSKLCKLFGEDNLKGE